jgi:hypothetical protein
MTNTLNKWKDFDNSDPLENLRSYIEEIENSPIVPFDYEKESEKIKTQLYSRLKAKWGEEKFNEWVNQPLTHEEIGKAICYSFALQDYYNGIGPSPFDMEMFSNPSCKSSQ